MTQEYILYAERCTIDNLGWVEIGRPDVILLVYSVISMKLLYVVIFSWHGRFGVCKMNFNDDQLSIITLLTSALHINWLLSVTITFDGIYFIKNDRAVDAKLR